MPCFSLAEVAVRVESSQAPNGADDVICQLSGSEEAAATGLRVWLARLERIPLQRCMMMIDEHTTTNHVWVLLRLINGVPGHEYSL